MPERPGRELMARRAARLAHDVHRAGEAVLGEAVRRAPLEEGTLRGSAELTMIVNGDRYSGTGGPGAAVAAAVRAVKSGSSVTVLAEISFNTVYAARQHEELDWEHPIDGEAKYLERPLGELGPRLLRLIEAGQKTVT